jgi:peptidoglycan/LPS O-acetylase OafA/YrhL
MSYSLYVFHFTYVAWFHDSVVPRLAKYMSTNFAFVVAACMAFCLTLMLSMLSYRFVERPVMNLKSRLKYGPVKKPIASEQSASEVLANVS